MWARSVIPRRVNSWEERWPFLIPVQWPEPFGLVMIEAMACGTPVIGFPRGSVPELVENGVNGFIVCDEQEAARM